MKKSYTVDSTCNDMRIDRWLRLKVGKIPQGLIEKYLRSGKIKINKKKVKSSTKVKTDDVINSFIVDFKETIVQKKIKFEPSKDIIKSNEDQIIDNNENFIVLNKSSGISVQGGTKSKKNLVDIFAKSEIFQGTKPYSVHRLDKDTSGVFIMAKTRESAQLLTSLFRLRKVHKTYLAICHGELVKDSGEWNDDLIRYDGKALQPERITGKQIEAARVALTRHMKRQGRVWTRVFPNIPVSKKPIEVRMGKGKGNPEFFACRVKPGRILFEVDGVSEQIAKEALYKASAKLPIKTKTIKRFA